ncbi:MAG: outer membrane beta-barrel protein, partial [candidate division KSB1 bacterium]
MKAQTLSRRSLAAAVVLMLPFAAHAQLLKGFGAKLGANSSNVSIAYTRAELQNLKVETGRKIGVNAAVFAEWLNTSVFSLVTQVEYAEQGFIQKSEITGENNPAPLEKVEATSQLNYVSLPILFKLRLPQSKLAPYVVFGPRFDWLVDHVDGNFESDVIDDFPAAPFTDYFETRSWGATAGFGFSPLALGGGSILVEARYNFDFKDNVALA